ncbi:MAG: thioredoxin family protein [[Clostridium] fimetarium]|nr:thioredoxin family protein [Alistipes timonensis]MCM1406395.1 thioredoxin family protein [[Clostridium] fimetarium]
MTTTYESYTAKIEAAPAALAEFYATWCPHCQKMMPVVAQVRELLEGRAVVAQYDIDRDQELAAKVEVQSIPTFIVYRRGEEVWRHTGEIDGEALLARVEAALR